MKKTVTKTLFYEQVIDKPKDDVICNVKMEVILCC